MRNMTKTIIASILLLISPVAIADTPSATMLANTCAGCHGTFGASKGPASPTIAGMSEYYFIETMQAYKNNQRPSTIMSRIAKGYTDEEIKLMAGYFAQQAFNGSPQNFDVLKADRGRRLHKKHCHKCHEEGGGYAEDDAGILAGQWEPFLRFTLNDFKTGKRTMGEKKKYQLDKLVKQQGEAGIDQLIHFYMSQY